MPGESRLVSGMQNGMKGTRETDDVAAAASATIGWNVQEVYDA